MASIVFDIVALRDDLSAGFTVTREQNSCAMTPRTSRSDRKSRPRHPHVSLSPQEGEVSNMEALAPIAPRGERRRRSRRSLLSQVKASRNERRGTTRRSTAQLPPKEEQASIVEELPPIAKRSARRSTTRSSSSSLPPQDGKASNMKRLRECSLKPVPARCSPRSSLWISLPGDSEEQDLDCSNLESSKTTRKTRMKRRPKCRSSICGDRRRRDLVHEAHLDDNSIDIAGLAQLSPRAFLEEMKNGSLCDDDEPDETCLQRQRIPSICSLYDALGVTSLEESIGHAHEAHFDEVSIDCSWCDDDEPDEVCVQMHKIPSICSLYDALGAQVYVIQESDETCSVDTDVGLEKSSICSSETDVPVASASDHDFWSDADEEQCVIPMVPVLLGAEEALVAPPMPPLPAKEFSGEFPVPRRSSSGRSCGHCGLEFRGFGDTCGSCRRVGRRGSIRQCVHCSEFFSGFHAACEDCP